MVKKIIIISAVNFVNGGPLTILRDCLSYLSSSELISQYRILAIVHNKNLALFPNIEYIEIPNSKKNWFCRLYYEYIYFYKISRKYSPFLWLSLHDITPNVIANKRVVYMHNPIPFFKWKYQDLKLAPVYVLFAMFYKYIYSINIHKNNYLIVQQDWLRNEFSKMFKFEKEYIIVNTPVNNITINSKYLLGNNKKYKYVFFYPSLARPFKNFEIICEAVKILNKRNIQNFEVFMTINGKESKYSKWIYNKYKNIPNIYFTGLLNQEQMREKYEQCDCLLFTSKLETWGLPISEFIKYNRPMIISDLFYAYETSQGSKCTCFFDPYNPVDLALKMQNAINKEYNSFKPQIMKLKNNPYAKSYKELFDIILE